MACGLYVEAGGIRPYFQAGRLWRRSYAIDSVLDRSATILVVFISHLAAVAPYPARHARAIARSLPAGVIYPPVYNVSVGHADWMR